MFGIESFVIYSLGVIVGCAMSYGLLKMFKEVE